MNRVAIDLGIINIYWYSIFIFLGMVAGFITVLLEARRKKFDIEELCDLAFYSVLIGILCARCYYVIFNLSYYLANPIEIIEVWNGGLAIHGGILGALVFLSFYCKKKNKKLLELTDMIVPGLIIAQAIGRWGNFFNSEAYGKITTLASLKSMHIPKFIIDGMYIDGAYRQPTFFFESVFNLLGFIVLLIVRKTNKEKTGKLTGIYLCLYGMIRVIIEYFRSDSLMLGPIKVAQLVSIIFIIAGMYLLFIYKEKDTRK